MQARDDQTFDKKDQEIDINLSVGYPQHERIDFGQEYSIRQGDAEN